jgi:uncharacterized protein YuzE
MDKKINIFHNLTFSYDNSADVLYISFGPARKGIAVEVDDGDFVRVDPYSDEVVGITILDFSERFDSYISKDIKVSAPLIASNILKEFKESRRLA